MTKKGDIYVGVTIYLI